MSVMWWHRAWKGRGVRWLWGRMELRLNAGVLKGPSSMGRVPTLPYAWRRRGWAWLASHLPPAAPAPARRYDSPYRGKLELSGCGGGMKGFASSEALPAEALAGAWQVAGGLRYTLEPGTAACSCTAADRGEPWEAGSLQGLVAHPLRAWSACSVGGECGGDICLAAGAVLGEGGARMAVATRRLTGGRLASVELLMLERA